MFALLLLLSCAGDRRIGVPITVLLVNRAFVPPEKGGFWRKWREWRICILTNKTRALLLEPRATTKMTKTAGVPRARAWFTKSTVSWTPTEECSNSLGSFRTAIFFFCVCPVFRSCETDPVQTKDLQEARSKFAVWGQLVSKGDMPKSGLLLAMISPCLNFEAPFRVEQMSLNHSALFGDGLTTGPNFIHAHPPPHPWNYPSRGGGCIKRGGV